MKGCLHRDLPPTPLRRMWGAFMTKAPRRGFCTDTVPQFLPVLSVPRIDCGLRLLVRGHFDEAETFRAVAHLVDDDDRTLDGAGLSKGLLQLIFGGRVRQTTDIQFLCHVSSEIFCS